MNAQFHAMVPAWYRPRVSYRDYVRRAAAVCDVLPSEIAGASRQTAIVRARWAVMVAMRRDGRSLPQIGARLHKDHTTIFHGLRRADELLATDAEFAALVAQVAIA